MQVRCRKLHGVRESGRGGVILQMGAARVIGRRFYWRRLVVRHHVATEGPAYETVGWCWGGQCVGYG
jgi:hypothetical protein